MSARHMSMSTPLHRLDPELKILHAPRQLMQLANNQPLGLQTQSRGFPAYQSLCCLFVVQIQDMKTLKEQCQVIPMPQT